MGQVGAAMTHAIKTTFAGGINPFARLGALPATTTKPKPIMQKPAKPAKPLLKDKDYSTPCKPPMESVQAKAPACTTPFELQITDDPIPASRATPAHKYHSFFETMKMGQSVRCATKDLGKISSAMRKYIEVKGLQAQTKGTRHYPNDPGYGRVWLLPVVAKALKVAA